MFQNLPDSGLVLLAGVPCSGKSTFASLAFPSGSVIGTDEIRSAIGLDRDDFEFDEHVFKILIDTVNAKLVAGRLAVVDSTSTRYDIVDLLLKCAATHGAQVNLIHFDEDLQSCTSRAQTRTPRPIPATRMVELSNAVEATIEKVKSRGVVVSRLRELMPLRGAGRTLFLGMPVTENIGHHGFRADKRAFYKNIHDALEFGGFIVESAAVNEDYGTINLQPAVFTRYDLEKIAEADFLLVTTPSSLSPDVYLEIGLTIGAGKPVGLVLPEGGRFTAMMHGLVDLGKVIVKELDRDDRLPYLALETGLALIGSA